MANKKYLLFTLLVLVIHIILAAVYANNQVIGSSQNLLLTNAYDALYNGKFSSFGDAFPGIGPTPGLLPSLLCYGALMIWDNPFSIMAMIVVLRIMAFVILSACFKKYFSNVTMCWFSVFFLLSPFILYNTTMTQDAFFLFGVALVTSSYVMLRKGTSFRDIYSREVTFTYDRKGWTFFGTMVLILGLFWCLETDYLGLIMLFLTLFMYMRRLLTFDLLLHRSRHCLVPGRPYRLSVPAGADLQQHSYRTLCPGRGTPSHVRAHQCLSSGDFGI